jgi:predicted ferric reductase
MNTLASAVLWVLLYLLLVTAPLLVLLTGPVPPGAGLWWDFSMALGFAGMAMLGVQFALTARFRRAAAPFGIDIIYCFHRYVALVAIGLLLAHYAIVRVAFADTLGPLDPLKAPGYMSAGRLALALFATVIVTSLWRKPLGIDYDRWRVGHALLAMAAFLLAVMHIGGVGYYTASPWKRWLWTGYTLAWVYLIVHVRAIKPWRMRRAPYRVAAVRPERDRAWTLTLVPDGHSGLRFASGQFAWLTLRGSPFRFKEHPFSFSSSAAQGERLEFTIKELGDFTRTIKDVRPGEVAYLDGPYGVFSAGRYPRSPGFVFIAGGVGIAPIMSMLRTLADRRDPRPLLLVYANSDWDDVIFREELESLRARVDLTLVHVLENPPPDWSGERGRITDALLRRVLSANRAENEYFLCGPGPMSETVQQVLHGMGIPLSRVHFELFNIA